MEDDNEIDFDFEGAYNELRVEYGLPDFVKLGEDFDIEKIADKESEFLVREIRRTINEKLSAYLHLFETLINPSAPPMFIFSILRGMGESDKEIVRDVYKKLSKLQIEVMKLDTVYSEKDESEFVVAAFNEWQNLKGIVFKIFEGFEENLEQDNGAKKSAYFG